MCLLEGSERSHHRDPKNVFDKLLLETVALQSREGILPNHAGVKLTEKELQLHPRSLTWKWWRAVELPGRRNILCYISSSLYKDCQLYKFFLLNSLANTSYE